MAAVTIVDGMSSLSPRVQTEKKVGVFGQKTELK